MKHPMKTVDLATNLSHLRGALAAQGCLSESVDLVDDLRVADVVVRQTPEGHWKVVKCRTGKLPVSLFNASAMRTWFARHLDAYKGSARPGRALRLAVLPPPALPPTRSGRRPVSAKLPKKLFFVVRADGVMVFAACTSKGTAVSLQRSPDERVVRFDLAFDPKARAKAGKRKAAAKKVGKAPKRKKADPPGTLGRVRIEKAPDLSAHPRTSARG